MEWRLAWDDTERAVAGTEGGIAALEGELGRHQLEGAIRPWDEGFYFAFLNKI